MNFREYLLNEASLSSVAKEILRQAEKEVTESADDNSKLKELESKLSSAEASYARRERTIAGNSEKQEIDKLKKQIKELKSKLGVKSSSAPSSDEFSHTINKPADVTAAEVKKAFVGTGLKVTDSKNYILISGPKNKKAEFQTAMAKVKDLEKKTRSKRSLFK